MSGLPSDHNGNGKQTGKSDVSKPLKIDNPMLTKLLNNSSQSVSLPSESVGGILPSTSQRVEGDNAPDVLQRAEGDNAPDVQQRAEGDNAPDVLQRAEGDNAPDVQQRAGGDNVPDVLQRAERDNAPDDQGEAVVIAVLDDQGAKVEYAPGVQQGAEGDNAPDDQGEEAGVAVPDDQQGAEVDHAPETQQGTENDGDNVLPAVQVTAADVDMAELTEVVPDAAAVPGKEGEVAEERPHLQSPERMQTSEPEGASAENFKKPTVSSRILNTKKRLEGMKLADESVPESSPRRSARLNKVSSELTPSDLTPANRTRSRMSGQGSISSNSEFEGSGDENTAKRTSRKKDPKK